MKQISYDLKCTWDRCPYHNCNVNLNSDILTTILKQIGASK